jgi:hypothetical protein
MNIKAITVFKMGKENLSVNCVPSKVQRLFPVQDSLQTKQHHLNRTYNKVLIISLLYHWYN